MKNNVLRAIFSLYLCSNQRIAIKWNPVSISRIKHWHNWMKQNTSHIATPQVKSLRLWQGKLHKNMKTNNVIKVTVKVWKHTISNLQHQAAKNTTATISVPTYWKSQSATNSYKITTCWFYQMFWFPIELSDNTLHHSPASRRYSSSQKKLNGFL